MFTGLVSHIGVVNSAIKKGNDFRLEIDVDWCNEGQKSNHDGLILGESIAVRGVCLTVCEITQKGFVAQATTESLSRTTLGQLKRNERVNLERALRLSDRLGGHILQGHIDTVGKGRFSIQSANFKNHTPTGGIEMWIDIDSQWQRYIALKGSVAIDGVSLTVSSIDKDGFAVVLIPHTLQQLDQHWQSYPLRVNVEFDILGKHIERLLSFNSTQQQAFNHSKYNEKSRENNTQNTQADKRLLQKLLESGYST